MLSTKGQLPAELDLIVATRCVPAFITGVLDQMGLLVPEGLDLLGGQGGNFSGWHSGYACD